MGRLKGLVKTTTHRSLKIIMRSITLAILLFAFTTTALAAEKITLNAKKYGFIAHVIGKGENIKEARIDAVEKMQDALSTLLSQSPQQSAQIAQFVKTIKVGSALIVDDFQYVEKGRYGNVRYLAAGVTTQSLTHIAERLAQAITHSLSHTSLQDVEHFQTQAQMLANLIEYSYKNNLPVDYSWQENVEKALLAVHDRLTKGLIIFDVSEEAVAIEVDNQLLGEPQIYLKPGRHYFQINKPGYHQIEGYLIVTAKEVRILPFTMIKHTPLNWPIQLQLNADLETHQTFISENLRILDLSVVEESPFTLTILLKSNFKFDDKDNRIDYAIKINLQYQRAMVLSQDYDYQNYVSSDDEFDLENVLNQFIAHALIDFVHQLNYDHKHMIEKSDEPFADPTVIE